MGSKTVTNTNAVSSADTQVLGSGEKSQVLQDSTMYNGSSVDNSQRTSEVSAFAYGAQTINTLDGDAIAGALKFANTSQQETFEYLAGVNALSNSQVEKLMAFNSETTQKTNDGLRAAFAGASGVATSPNMPYYLAAAALVVLVFVMKGR